MLPPSEEEGAAGRPGAAPSLASNDADDERKWEKQSKNDVRVASWFSILHFGLAGVFP